MRWKPGLALYPGVLFFKAASGTPSAAVAHKGDSNR